MTKFGSIKMGVPPLGPPKFKLLIIQAWNVKLSVRMDKHNGKIKYDRVKVTTMVLPARDRRN